MLSMTKLKATLGKAIGTSVNPEDRIELIRMTIEDYLALPSNSRQRDTEENAKKAIAQKRFDIQYPSHTVVFVAEDKQGNRMLIDGHTRQYLIANGKISRPNYINVILTYVDAMSEASVLYTHYDSALAVETSRQQAIGAMRELGMKAKYTMIASGSFLSALHTVGAKGDVYARVADYKKELIIADSFGLSKNTTQTSILAAMLLTLGKDTEKAIEFWQLYCSGTVVTRGNKRDTVGMLMEEIDTRKREKRNTGGMNIKEVTHIALWCYSEWLANKFYSVFNKAPGSTSIPDFLKK